MNKLITLVCMDIMLIASSAAYAGPQQQKMKSCNKEAKSKLLKGDERKAFMKNCLSSKAGLPSNSVTPDVTHENKQGHKK
ncbi:MAG: PsiF family protein [Gallionellaceae bacterium]